MWQETDEVRQAFAWFLSCPSDSETISGTRSTVKFSREYPFLKNASKL